MWLSPDSEPVHVQPYSGKDGVNTADVTGPVAIQLNPAATVLVTKTCRATLNDRYPEMVNCDFKCIIIEWTDEVNTRPLYELFKITGSELISHHICTIIFITTIADYHL